MNMKKEIAAGGLIVCLIIVVIIIFHTEVEASYTKTVCVEETLDFFDECVDLGWESSGFLSSNHYYLCDGVKVTNKCTKYEEKTTIKNTTISEILSGAYRR